MTELEALKKLFRKHEHVFNTNMRNTDNNFKKMWDKLKEFNMAKDHLEKKVQEYLTEHMAMIVELDLRVRKLEGK